MKKIFAFVLPLVCLLAPLQAGQARLEPAQKQNRLLLERVADSAQEVFAAAERIEGFNHSPNEFSRQSHMLQLENVKEGINMMTRDLDRLAASRETLDQADRRAVNRVLIAAVELAQTANAAILKAGRFEATPGLSLEYRRLMETCARQAGDLLKALNAGVEELK